MEREHGFQHSWNAMALDGNMGSQDPVAMATMNTVSYMIRGSGNDSSSLAQKRMVQALSDSAAQRTSTLHPKNVANCMETTRLWYAFTANYPFAWNVTHVYGRQSQANIRFRQRLRTITSKDIFIHLLCGIVCGGSKLSLHPRT